MSGDTSGGTRVAMVMAAIRRRIAGRSLTPGDKLPSIRSCAATMQVSASTVVEAYDRLVAEGIIRSRPGSGFYVASQTAPLALSEVGPKRDRAIDPFWVSRQSLEAGSTDLMPGCGWLPPSWLPEDAMRRALRTVSRGDVSTLADYGTPLGLPPLRQLIARRMADHGIDASPDQIMLAESGTQALDLLCRLLLEPGDTVLVDDPCYFNFHALLRAHRARLVSVAYTPSGPDVEHFAQVLDTHRPRLYITNSAVHNPTGATLSPVTAHRVLKLAEQFGLTIVEDDILADFEHAPASRLAAFDGLDRVIHIGSFSKTLSASARCGFIATRPDWIEGLTDLKIATSFGGGRLTAELVFNILRDPSYRKYIEALRVRLSRAMGEVIGRLKSVGIEPWLEPQAGMFLWAKLPDGIDAAAVARKALSRDVVLAPGNAFSLSQSAIADSCASTFRNPATTASSRSCDRQSTGRHDRTLDHCAIRRRRETAPFPFDPRRIGGSIPPREDTSSAQAPDGASCNAPSRGSTIGEFPMSEVSKRVAAADAAFRPIADFYFRSRYADRRFAEGISDFTFGNPHEMPLDGIVDALRDRAMPHDKNWFAYKTSEDEPRAFLAERMSAELGLAFEPEDIALTPGAFAALSVAMRLVLDAGDEAIFSEPAWFCYEPMLEAANAVSKKVMLTPGTFDLDLDAIDAAITPKTRMVIVNTPHNPTGRIYDRETLAALADLLDRASARINRRIFLISDEPYRRLRFDDRDFVSPAAVYPWTFIVYSYGKVLLAPGQRLGYLAASPLMPRADRDTLREAFFPAQMALGWVFPNALMQYAIPDLEGLTIDTAALARRRDTLMATLKASGYDVVTPEGTFYLFSRWPAGGINDPWNALADRDVFVMPGSILNAPDHFRISLTASDAMVERSLPAFREVAQSG